MHNNDKESKREQNGNFDHFLNYEFDEFIVEDGTRFISSNGGDKSAHKDLNFNNYNNNGVNNNDKVRGDNTANHGYRNNQKSFDNKGSEFGGNQIQNDFYNQHIPVYEIEELKEVIYYKNRREIESIVGGFKKEDIETVFSIQEGDTEVINVSNISLEYKRVGLTSGYYCNHGIFWGKNLRSLFVNTLLSVEVLMNQYPQDNTGNYPYPNTEKWGYVNSSLYYLAYQGNLNKYYDDFIKLIENKPLLTERIEENVDQFGNKIKEVGEATGEVVGTTTKGIKGIAERVWKGDPNRKQYMSNSDSSFIGLFALIAILYYFFK